jgi:predicted  nucleic acid-binding Zn-ribbon protein
MTDEKQKLHEESSRLREESSRLHEESSRLHEESSRLREESSRLREESSRLREESSRLNSELDTASDNLQMAKMKMESFVEKVAAMERERDAAIRENYDLKCRIEAVSRENTALNAEKTTSNTYIECLRININALTNSVQEAYAEVEKLRGELDDAKREIAYMWSREDSSCRDIDSLTKEVETLREQNARLQSLVDNCICSKPKKTVPIASKPDNIKTSYNNVLEELKKNIEIRSQKKTESQEISNIKELDELIADLNRNALSLASVQSFNNHEAQDTSTESQDRDEDAEKAHVYHPGHGINENTTTCVKRPSTLPIDIYGKTSSFLQLFQSDNRFSKTLSPHENTAEPEAPKAGMFRNNYTTGGVTGGDTRGVTGGDTRGVTRGDARGFPRGAQKDVPTNPRTVSQSANCSGHYSSI